MSEHPVDHRASVGPRHLYDAVAAMQFNLLTSAGLREFHTLLDIGCGSLRGGRLFIPYLRAGKYFGLEPNRWLVEEGIRSELGAGVVELKRPTFCYSDDFDLAEFATSFDFLLAQSIFSHASASQITRCFEQAAEVMHPDALFLATFLLGDHDYGGADWVYPGTVTYTWPTIERMAGAAGLRARTVDWPHSTGQQWAVLWLDTRDAPPELEVSPLAYKTALADLRSQVDWYVERLSADEAELAALRRRPGARLRRLLRGR